MYKRILVSIDGSDTSNRALASAISLAKAFNARIRLVNVIDEGVYMPGYDPSGAYAGELIRAVREAGNKILRDGMDTVRAADIEVDCMLFEKFGARLGDTVADAAKLWNADLVVVGTHGRKGFNRLLLGSGAEQIIRLSPVPVLAVRDLDKEAA